MRFQIVRNNIETFGLLSTIRAELAKVVSPNYHTRGFDGKYGTDTGDFLSVADGKLPVEYQREAQGYEPSAEPVVAHILRRLPIRPEEFAFIDAGCGKGRVLLLASFCPFTRIIGVELSSILCEIARENVKRFSQMAGERQKCGKIEILSEDVLKFPIPAENIVFFLFNPFQGSLFEAFMKRVHEHAARQPTRKVVIAYYNPWSGTPWLEKTGYFRRIYEHRVILGKMSWSLWEPIL